MECGKLKEKWKGSDTMKLAILGPGRIAHTVAPALVALPEIECYAIASRNLERAKSFAEQFGFV